MKRPYLQKHNMWKERFISWQASGLSIKKWCKNHKIADTSFHYWKSKFQPSIKLSKSSFIELPQETPSGIEIELDGVKIFLKKDFDSQTLVNCIKALRGKLC